jgi:hypothetical protein
VTAPARWGPVQAIQMGDNSFKPRDVIGASLRCRVDPRDVPAAKAARKIGLTLVEFDRVKAELFARGFPTPDPTTGLYDLKAIEVWRDVRSGLAEPLTASSQGGQRSRHRLRAAAASAPWVGTRSGTSA